LVVEFCPPLSNHSSAPSNVIPVGSPTGDPICRAGVSDHPGDNGGSASTFVQSPPPELGASELGASDDE
jgi:hypothetical protein